MKRVILAAFLLAAAAPLMADEILMKDGTVVKGKIIQVTPAVIEYDPEGPSVFEQIPRDRASKIIYDDGKELVLAIDILETTGREIIRCTILEITKDTIRYRPEGSAEEKTIARTEVKRILFNDGRAIDPSKKDEEKADDKADDKTIGKKPEGGFMSSWVRVGTFVQGGAFLGDITGKERRVVKQYRIDLSQAYLLPRAFHLENGYYGGGADFDFMFPALRRVQKRGFDFTGVKFGVKGRYGRDRVESVMISRNYGDMQYGRLMGTLMKFDYWSAGPVMNLCFTPRNNFFTFILNFYGMAGQIIDGKISAAAALRDSGMLGLRIAGVGGFGPPYAYGGDVRLAALHQKAFNTAKLKGYTVRAGFGPEIAFNKKAPFVIGLHLTYAYTKLNLSKALPVYYSGNRGMINHQVGGELSVGLHF